MRPFRYFIFLLGIFFCTAFILSSCKDDGGPTDTNSNPEVTGISPNSGSAGDEVTITGSNFSSTQANNLVSFNGTEATLTSASSTRLVATVPSAATSGSITVAVDGQTATGPNFEVTMMQALSITSDSTFTVEENQPAVGTVTASNPDGDAPGFSISGGDDQTQFTIDQNSGALTFTASPDFEAPHDANTDNVYQVQVSASDGSNSASQNLTITVTDIDEDQAPTITSDAEFNVDENQTAAGIITAEDPNGDDLSFSITGGDDQSLFSIDAGTGQLIFNAAPDFEDPADANTDNVYQVQVSASDGSNSASQNLTITVTDIDEDQAPTISSDTEFSVEENQTTVATITASDPNGDDLTFSLEGGDDQGQFSIDANSGALSFNSEPDFENPADTNADNVYQVQVSASDGSNSASQNLTITVTDVNENQAPTISSDTEFNVEENQTTVATITADDPDGDDLTFSLGSGVDQSLFSIDANSGRLTFNSAPDFEAPADANTDNVYQLQVSASDGSESASQSINISVTDVTAGPVAFTSGSIALDDGRSFNASAPDFTFDAVPENIDIAAVSGGIQILAEATERNFDPSNLSVTVSGPDASFINDTVTIASINTTSPGTQTIDLRLSFNGESPDFENPVDAGANNTYIVDITITDTRNGDAVTQRLTTPISDVDGE